ncbi:hypothetical protein TNCV_4281201 [Trichonephila clavipes]|nr:hypothetical protein TNCV_4281201 [Trichonephila clavipes]
MRDQMFSKSERWGTWQSRKQLSTLCDKVGLDMARSMRSCTVSLKDDVSEVSNIRYSDQTEDLRKGSEYDICERGGNTTVLLWCFQRTSSALSRVLGGEQASLFTLELSSARGRSGVFSQSKVARVMAEDRTSQYLGVHV